jgi:hypothetical protein
MFNLVVTYSGCMDPRLSQEIDRHFTDCRFNIQVPDDEVQLDSVDDHEDIQPQGRRNHFEREIPLCICSLGDPSRKLKLPLQPTCMYTDRRSNTPGQHHLSMSGPHV